MLMAADVVGALLVPTLAARLLDKGTAAMSFHAMTVTALQMIAASLDMSVFDFRQLGTASMVTRTMSDVVNIQVVITDVIMMMLPVPFIFVVALTFAFSLDTVLDNEANNLSVGQRQLLQEVWGPTYGTESNYLRLYMIKLRRKLEPVPSRPRHLITEPGLGFRLQA